MGGVVLKLFNFKKIIFRLGNTKCLNSIECNVLNKYTYRNVNCKYIINKSTFNIYWSEFVQLTIVKCG